jgi:hypothetical protein
MYQGSAPGAVWLVVPADDTWATRGAQDLNGVPLQDLPTYIPLAESAADPGLDPVPEPSQLALMFTVITLVALAAKRSVIARRIAGRPGGSTSY